MLNNQANKHENTDSYNAVRKMIFQHAIDSHAKTSQNVDVHFNDVVETTKNDMVESRLNSGIGDVIVEGDSFRAAMLVFTFLDCLVLAIGTYEEMVLNAHIAFGFDIVSVLRSSFLMVFMWEMIFKLCYGTKKFFRTSWNFLDIFLIAGQCFGSGKFWNNIGCIRALRILRPFKATKYAFLLEGCQLIIQTVWDSLPDMLNVSFLVLILMFTWAVIGTRTFGLVAPAQFGNVGYSYFSLLVAVTQIGWIEDYHILEYKGYYTSAAIFYSSFIVIAVLVVTKVIMALLVANLEESYRKREMRKKRKYHRLETKKQIEMGVFSQKTQLPPKRSDPIWKSQIPFELPNFDNISSERLEKYFITLAIMEGNYAEFQRLKEELKAIQAEVKQLNMAVGSESNIKRTASQTTVDSKKGQNADVLTQLLQRKST